MFFDVRFSDVVIHSILSSVDGGQHVLFLVKQRGVPAKDQSNALLWKGTDAKPILASLRKYHLN